MDNVSLSASLCLLPFSSSPPAHTGPERSWKWYHDPAIPEKASMSLLLGTGKTPCLDLLNIPSLCPRHWAGYQLRPAAEAASGEGPLDQAGGQAGVGGNGCSETHVHQLLPPPRP